MKNRKGFTLIELLAVVIVLGILMLIAVPAVTSYIDDSRKNGYVSTAKSITGGVRTLANSTAMDFTDPDITYYVEGKCVKTETDLQSPYADFDKAYVIVTTTEDGHDYYWTSVDKKGVGVKNITPIDKLSVKDIETGINSDDIQPNKTIEGRSKVAVVGGENCTMGEPYEVTDNLDPLTGEISAVCPRVTDTIYWAIQSSGTKLVLSSTEVSGEHNGSFPGSSEFASWGDNKVPWLDYAYEVSTVEVNGTIVPASTSSWFYEVGISASSFYADLRNIKVCHVSDMSYMFNNAARYVGSFNVNISGWDTSNVLYMNNLFYNAGSGASTWSVQGLTGLNTSHVTNMEYMLENAAENVSSINMDFSGWNTANVTLMSYLFDGFGRNASSFSLNVSGWNTGKVTRMTRLFGSAGRYATTWSIQGLGSWNTGSVTDMESMFANAGESASSFSLDLRNWNTSNVTEMYHIFEKTGYNATSYNLNISNWNMSSVTSMYNMFYNAASNATSYSIIVPKTNGNGINNTTTKIYGNSSSTYSDPPSGKTYTLAS